MFAVLRNARKPLLRITAALSTMALVACAPGAMSSSGGSGQKTDPSTPVQVALLVPGGTANPGEALLARQLRLAAELAVADQKGVNIDLRVYNTGGSSAQAAQVANQAVDEGAKIILGPLHGEAANAAGVAVAPRGVNVLAFSNNTDIAGGNVFVLGPTFANTATRLASYAAKQGKRRIHVVSEQTPAGEAGARAIEAAVSRAGASLAGRTSFPRSQDGVSTAAPKIATAASAGADAVFITSNTDDVLPFLADALNAKGVTSPNPQLIGLTRWDIPAAAMQLPGLQGGWFAMPDRNLTQAYEARFQAAYGESPHALSGLAYDGISAIAALAKTRGSDAFTQGSLTQNAGFVGVSGVFRFRSDGSNERGLAIAEIRNGQAVIVEAAPRSFGGAGF
ncbi:penicillin-binding protein activator [Albirhodobacter sp. R86504]|uniref:penicillin-binding protein activator n=1 Tax=Albirhodobacter sp. R86504 TaxID=3093848 RepID=UPI00366D193F